MPQIMNLTVDVRLNLEGDWPRAAYLRLCQHHGVEYTEAGYLRWREVGERLSGRPCFETQVKRASAAMAKLGISIAQAGGAFANAVKAVQRAEEARDAAAASGREAGSSPQPTLLHGQGQR